jgi:ABC-type lipoprotein export system ATPase subunit
LFFKGSTFFRLLLLKEISDWRSEFMATAEEIHSFAATCFVCWDLEDKLHHKPLELSGGEQQRVALARAVVTRPAIVLADEPTGNLDSENSALVLNMFQELNYRFNQTIIMITHNPEAAAMCRRIVQMRDGHIVEQAPTVRLYLQNSRLQEFQRTLESIDPPATVRVAAYLQA